MRRFMTSGTALSRLVSWTFTSTVLPDMKSCRLTGRKDAISSSFCRATESPAIIQLHLLRL